GRVDVEMLRVGDGVIENAVTGGQCPDPAITDPDHPDYDEDCHNVLFVRQYEVVKSGTPSDPSPGDTVTYTVTVSNTGGLDYTGEFPATVSDDMSGALDDASYNDDAAVDPDTGALAYAEPTLTWEGPLPAGESVTITYTM